MNPRARPRQQVLGAIACGHPETARAAETVLQEGGNAFDAILAAFLTCCVTEPVLASLGGGGFMLAHTPGRAEVIYDFFAHTPKCPLPADRLDFYPIHADFGATRQEFHIGLASIATPGAVRGIYRIHRDLCTLPMRDIARPAIEAAREGTPVNALQAYIFSVIEPILMATPESREHYRGGAPAGTLIAEGERFRQPDFANFLEALVAEGEDLFYRGEVASAICDMTRYGGQLTAEDLAGYEVILREPASVRFRDHRVITNPAPSCGGTLIAFALNMLEQAGLHRDAFGSHRHLDVLASVMRLTNEARIEATSLDHGDAGLSRLLDERLMRDYREKISGNCRSLRGTTHISVMDSMGNVAGLTASNGEGCGHMVADTGIMLNNMLGEEDLNPAGFYRWPPDRRMTSMMAPTLVISPDGSRLCLGSGGSNRLRTAILQVLVNRIEFAQSLHDAVNLPRIHFEHDLLSVEPGFSAGALEAVFEAFPRYKLWESKNLFFGGVHAVASNGRGYEGAGDNRRGGVAKVVS